MGLDEEWFYMTEWEIKNKVKPTPTLYALRVSFWREFERVAWRGEKTVTPASVFGGICGETFFYNKVLKDQGLVAWMIRPVQGYQREMEAILHRCTERLWELIDLPIKNSKGQVDPRVAKIVLDVIGQVENRVKGMAIQRTEAKSLSVNVVTRSKLNAKMETVEALDQRIKQLEAELNETPVDGATAALEPRADVRVERAVVHIDAPKKES